MDKIVEDWKAFLLEYKKGIEIPYQIYCDMDGVLVDLEEGVEVALGLADIEEEVRSKAIQVVHSGIQWQKIKSEPGFKGPVQAIFDVLSEGSYNSRKHFWANLKFAPGAEDLWKMISQFDPKPIILTAPWSTTTEEGEEVIDRACVEGKREWLKRLNPSPKNIIIAGTEKGFEGNRSKHRYAGAKNILIDDMEIYLEPWHAEGGIAIKHTSVGETKKKLKKLDLSIQ